ncbi:MAG TPA: hypothetical protein VGK67_01940 [Myxococcales bacterium]|jgi:hypothetical protein
MPASTVITSTRGADLLSLATGTVDQLRAAVGSLPVRAGVLYASGVPHAGLSKALASLLPGVDLMGGTTLDAEPSLVGLWLVGDVRAVVAQRLREDQEGWALAEAAITRAGFKAFQTRLALLHTREQGEKVAAQVFEVLPKGAAFLGAELPEVWTNAGPVAEALLVADWQGKLAAGFETTAQALERKGIPADACVGMLRLHTGLTEITPAPLTSLPQISAHVNAIFGVPGRSMQSPANGTLVLSILKERAE